MGGACSPEENRALALPACRFTVITGGLVQALTGQLGGGVVPGQTHDMGISRLGPRPLHVLKCPRASQCEPGCRVQLGRQEQGPGEASPHQVTRSCTWRGTGAGCDSSKSLGSVSRRASVRTITVRTRLSHRVLSSYETCIACVCFFFFFHFVGMINYPAM